MPKRMHQQEVLLEELAVVDSQAYPLRYMLECWSHNIDPGYSYSTSAHLCALVDICFGLGAKRVGEIGFGRSSFILGHVARLNGGNFVACDRYDYRYMLDVAGIDWVDYIIGDANAFYSRVKTVDFLFLDYMSTRKKSTASCYKDLKWAVKMLPTNGIVAVHDAYCPKYNVAAALDMVKDKFGKGVEVLTLPYGNGLGIIRRCSKSPHGILKDRWEKKADEKPA